MERDDKFPPVDVYHNGETYYLADGFHRVRAAQRANLTTIAATVHQGTRRDAILHSVKANTTHGLRRTNADKRRAVETLLRDDEWCQWSDNAIAKQCGVSQPFVSKLRAEICPSYNGYKMERTVTRDGKTYTQNVNNIGQANQSKQSDIESDNASANGISELTETGEDELSPAAPDNGSPTQKHTPLLGNLTFRESDHVDSLRHTSVVEVDDRPGAPGGAVPEPTEAGGINTTPLHLGDGDSSSSTAPEPAAEPAAETAAETEAIAPTPDQDKIDELLEALKGKQDEIEQLKTERDQLDTQVKSLQETNENLTSENRTLDQKLKAITDELTDLKRCFKDDASTLANKLRNLIKNETGRAYKDLQTINTTYSEYMKKEARNLLTAEEQEQINKLSQIKVFKKPPFNQSQLAVRFGQISRKTGKPNYSYISSKKLEPDFTDWSRSQDPEKIGWRYSEKWERFYPLP